MNNNHGFIIYLLSVLAAMIIRVAPWPEFMQFIMPDWILLVLIYWCLAIPERVGIVNAWFVGLLTDVLTGRLLGQYALTYAVVCYPSLKLHKRLRHFPLLQQGMFIFSSLLLSQLLVFWIENIHSPTRFHLSFWLPALTGTVCWPVVFMLLRKLRYSYRIT